MAAVGGMIGVLLNSILLGLASGVTVIGALMIALLR